ncbi:MAG: L-rhamnose mutarotase [Chthoniobacteraceae bacterium]|nr:L-rhamnose mutarotase [Chthoniobacteraceae bacterium]
MQLHPGKLDEYQRRHDPIWPELKAALRDHGVTSYSIFLHAGTYQLFAYAEVESEERWQLIGQTAVCRRWWAFMRDLMETNSDNSPRSEPLVEVFQLPI